ncbi:MAG TPA: hypothetical protein VJN68_16050 [Burkholderiaceae bacterium]|nr:hypothetical protein [Burkholderiaceae bacterium]
MDPHRFRLATRIHFALLRQYGEDVDVATLLKGSPEAREALWVCAASDDRELVELAAQFKRASKTPAPPTKPLGPADAPQDVAWARDTSGFGATMPVDLEAPRRLPVARTLLKPSSWLRKSAH